MSANLTTLLEKKQPTSERCLLAYKVTSRLQLILDHVHELPDSLEDKSILARHLNLIQEATSQTIDEIAKRGCPFSLSRRCLDGSSGMAKPAKCEAG